MKSLRFIDLFAGLGGFHLALTSLGHHCVFASEIDDELRDLYLLNFPSMKGKLFGDIRSREVKTRVPSHDVLCAGFPCQPFSKSGGQLGTRDETRGTLFHEILEILEDKKPQYVLLENVGNFGRHDGGRTWQVVRERLSGLGYVVSGTEHLTQRPKHDWRDAGNGALSKTPRGIDRARDNKHEGHGLISPHHFGYPHHRERFFIVAARGALPRSPFPALNRKTQTSLDGIVQLRSELRAADLRETRLSSQQIACINHWNALISALPAEISPPSFPLWGDELGASYPFEKKTPWATPTRVLIEASKLRVPAGTHKSDLLERLPSYAREATPAFRNWKIRYIRLNREWWNAVRPHLPKNWAKQLREFPPSLRKLEWNAKGGERNLWRYVLQFRPSGIRVKRYENSPALVAMTATQIPILGPKRRFITRVEALRLQGFPDSHALPSSRNRAFKALGNAVHVCVAMRVAAKILSLSAQAAIANATEGKRARRKGVGGNKGRLRRQG